MLALARFVTIPRVLVVIACAALVLPLAPVADAATATVAQLAPTFGPVGTVVDITGSGLTTASDVLFNGTDAGVPTVIDDTHIQSTVPDGATAGVVSVTTGDGSVDGPTFTVQLPTDGTVAVSATDVVFPGGAEVTGALTAAGVAVRDQGAQLQRAVRGSPSWVDAGKAKTTSKTGHVSWHVAPGRTSAFRILFSDSTGYLGTRTTAVHVHVHPHLTLDVPQVAPILTTIPIKGVIRPSPDKGSVVLERRTAGGSWERAGKESVAGRRHFRFEVSLPSTGTFAYRARRAPDATHGGGKSAAGRMRAVQRSLHSGMTGPDVRALQRQLTSLHYDVAGVTGQFSYDTLHAVVAFQKVQGLDRDGVVGVDVWKALDNPRQPRLRHPEDAQSAGIEVDLKHQVVLYAVNGRVKRILDSSTGGGYYYTGSDGTQQRAITPTGHFKVVYKRDGWVTSDLGTLYRPAYFNYSGYAIHGEDEVPSYPASHGCVRITVPAMDRLNAKLPIGLSFWVY
jgi:hypothetical protein